MIGELGFDLLLVGDSFLFVLERTIKEAVLSSMVWRHDAPPEMIAVADGAAMEWRMLDGLHKGKGQPHRRHGWPGIGASLVPVCGREKSANWQTFRIT